jgi:hypothetical protein
MVARAHGRVPRAGMRNWQCWSGTRGGTPSAAARCITLRATHTSRPAGRPSLSAPVRRPTPRRARQTDLFTTVPLSAPLRRPTPRRAHARGIRHGERPERTRASGMHGTVWAVSPLITRRAACSACQGLQPWGCHPVQRSQHSHVHLIACVCVGGGGGVWSPCCSLGQGEPRTRVAGSPHGPHP